MTETNEGDFVSPDWVVEIILLLDATSLSNHDDAAVIARGYIADGYGDCWVIAPNRGVSKLIDGRDDVVESEVVPEE